MSNLSNLEITIHVPDLAMALENLATAISEMKQKPAAPQGVTSLPNPAPRPQQPAQAFPTAPVQTYTPPVNPTTAGSPAPTAKAPEYALDDLAKAAAALMDAGKQQQQLIALLGQYQVPSLMQLPKEQYGSFATALRQMGAKI